MIHFRYYPENIDRLNDIVYDYYRIMCTAIYQFFNIICNGYVDSVTSIEIHSLIYAIINCLIFYALGETFLSILYFKLTKIVGGGIMYYMLKKLKH